MDKMKNTGKKVLLATAITLAAVGAQARPHFHGHGGFWGGFTGGLIGGWFAPRHYYMPYTYPVYTTPVYTTPVYTAPVYTTQVYTPAQTYTPAPAPTPAPAATVQPAATTVKAPELPKLEAGESMTIEVKADGTQIIKVTKQPATPAPQQLQQENAVNVRQ